MNQSLRNGRAAAFIHPQASVTPMKETPIRANEMVRLIRDQLHEEIKGMTPEDFKELVTREAGKALPPSDRVADAQC